MSTARHPNPILDVQGLTVEYGHVSEAVRAVDNLDLRVESGDALAIVGESGSGKTTLALAMTTLLSDVGGCRVTGSVEFRAQNVLSLSARELRGIRGTQIGCVFQDPMTALNPSMTVGRQVAEVLRIHQISGRAASIEAAIQALKLVGIPDASRRAFEYPYQYSGGMRQRAMIAMALVSKPALLVADEPTTALDASTRAQILDLMRRLKDQLKMTLVLVTHDLMAAATICNKLAVMYAGQIVECGPIREVLAQPRMPYTARLLEALPTLSTRRDIDAPTIPGDPPDMAKPKPGCRFAPRCTLAKEVCWTDMPTLSARGNDCCARCHASEEHGWWKGGK